MGGRPARNRRPSDASGSRRALSPRRSPSGQPLAEDFLSQRDGSAVKGHGLEIPAAQTLAHAKLVEQPRPPCGEPSAHRLQSLLLVPNQGLVVVGDDVGVGDSRQQPGGEGGHGYCLGE
jgi:hypothetical protein